MNATHQDTRTLDDLAGYWTEPAMEILRNAGLAQTIATEVEIWQTLIAGLRSELRWRRIFGSKALSLQSRTLMGVVSAFAHKHGLPVSADG